MKVYKIFRKRKYKKGPQSIGRRKNKYHVEVQENKNISLYPEKKELHEYYE